ncbi:hypothetical protein EGR_00320 [Echinococcus granulosus]|uniref:Uncharacterized protein n=1 Tax=Echinococcus granulosus TaxID=6210 RepID=W6UWN2_ECHGR|nr:hypothetical protein EGR_00320 [Echinococcus granulosus]EUB65051.1 hypothetical protein EGR_00320 [Echinococcus granulosus]
MNVRNAMQSKVMQTMPVSQISIESTAAANVNLLTLRGSNQMPHIKRYHQCTTLFVKILLEKMFEEEVSKKGRRIGHKQKSRKNPLQLRVQCSEDLCDKVTNGTIFLLESVENRLPFHPLNREILSNRGHSSLEIHYHINFFWNTRASKTHRFSLNALSPYFMRYGTKVEVLKGEMSSPLVAVSSLRNTLNNNCGLIPKCSCAAPILKFLNKDFIQFDYCADFDVKQILHTVSIAIENQLFRLAVPRGQDARRVFLSSSLLWTISHPFDLTYRYCRDRSPFAIHHIIHINISLFDNHIPIRLKIQKTYKADVEKKNSSSSVLNYAVCFSNFHLANEKCALNEASGILIFMIICFQSSNDLTFNEMHGNSVNKALAANESLFFKIVLPDRTLPTSLGGDRMNGKPLKHRFSFGKNS